MPRQRHRGVFLGFDPKTKKPLVRVHSYTPKTGPAAKLKEQMIGVARLAYVGPPIENTVRLDLEFVYPRPKYLTWKKKPMPRAVCTNADDLDNLAKLVMDALTTAEVWKRDNVVAELACRKIYAAGEERPHTRIVITSLEIPPS